MKRLGVRPKALWIKSYGDLPDKDVDDKDLELEQACIDRFKSGEKARGDHETTREYKHFIRGSERVCYKSLLLHDAHLQLYDSDEQAIYETQYGQATLATRKFSEGKARQAIRTAECWLEANNFRTYIPDIFHDTTKLHPLITVSVIYMVLNGPDLFTDKDIIGEWFYDRVIDPGRYRTWLLSRHGERRIRHGADVINCITYHEEELRDDYQEMALSLVEEFRELEAGKSNYFKERRIEWKDNNAHLVLRKIAKQRKIDRWRREHKEAMKPITESYPFLSDVYSTDFECNRYGDGPTQERIEALPSDFKRNLTTNQASLEEIEIYHDLANSGLTPKQLVYAKEMLRTPQLKDTDLAEEFNVTRRTVWTNRRDVKKALDLAGIEPTRSFSTFLGPLTSNFPTEDAFRLNDPNPEPEEMPMCPSGCGPLGKLEVEGESREDIIGCNVCKLAMPAEY